MRNSLSQALLCLLLSFGFQAGNAQAPLFVIRPDATCPSIGFKPFHVPPEAESYNWNLGDGRFATVRQPDRWYYHEAGEYIVKLRIVTKRGQKLLYNVQVLNASGWGEFPLLDEFPDFYVQFSGLNGPLLYSSPYVEDTKPPVDVPAFFLLEEQFYQLRVMDWDAFGNDDLMGTVFVDGQLSGQELVDGKLRIKWQAEPAKEMYQWMDTVRVIVPKLLIRGDSLVVEAEGLEWDSRAGLQWFLNGELIAESKLPRIKPALEGDYSAKLNVSGLCGDLTATVHWPDLVATHEPSTLPLGRIYPNPALPRTKINWLYTAPTNTKATVKITDPWGRKVAQYRFSLQTGENLLDFPAPAQRGSWLIQVQIPQQKLQAFSLVTQ